MRLNSDMGEAFGIYDLGADEALMEHVSLANVACGFHAGDPEVAEAIADAAGHFGAPLMGMAGTEHERVYSGRGLEFWAEYYVDLDYDDDGGLIITRRHVAYDPAEATARLERVMRDGVA